MESNPLIPFLRSYGPNAASDSLYDEHVQAAAQEHGVKEIKMSAPLVDKLGALLTGDTPTNVILTGTAGDGKTFHIRQVFLKHLGGQQEDWPGSDLVITVPLANARQLRIIRDLSELPASRKVQEISHITRCLTGQDDRTFYLLAANDGQLLEMWRRIASENEGPETASYSRVYKTLTNMLRQEDEIDPKGFLKVRLYNLSRRTQPDIVYEAIKAILAHPMWEVGCARCPLFGGQKESCPIRINRRLLKGVAERPESQVFRSRLRDAIALATANDQHMPLRQLLTLVVNVVLGDSENRDTPLLTCATAIERAKSGQYRWTNPYDNAVGANLAEDTCSRYAVFSTIETFGIGLETTNQFDALLLHQRPTDLAKRLDQVDPVYGEALFRGLRAQYLNSPRERLSLKSFTEAMTSQRRRLFFQLPAEATHGMGTEWSLTVFHNGAKYLAFREKVATGEQHVIVDQVMRQMIKGFNRALTGMMTDDTETLWVAGSIGKSDDPTGRVTTMDGIRRTRGTGLLHLEVDHNEKRNRPQVRVVSQYHVASVDRLPVLEVRPLLFEYLLRVAEGSLPSSFSRQCHQEIKHFATMLQQQVAHIPESEALSLAQVQTLSLDSDSSIKRNDIKVNLL